MRVFKEAFSFVKIEFLLLRAVASTEKSIQANGSVLH